ncbi:hypothetical protein DB30_07996 [Enhygromyxa salina]|uniref:Uncharacterized protein n=1 Tax=Enhygromyxa salina TaxID=215803 RepID=A0A0C1Z769_9BACT|nr:hypothetical protein DB30_07996 [Enhygromyxa salina]
MLSLALALVAACGSEPTRPVSVEHAPALWSLDYSFVVRSVGVANSAQPLVLDSVARGRLTVVSLDEPPLLVGSLAVDHMELRSGNQTLARLGAGEWSYLARRGSDGTIDAVWLAADMPAEAQSLTRFLIAQLQTPTPGITASQEQTPTGTVDARYHHFDLQLARFSVRTRRSPARAPDLRGATIFIADERGPVVVGSGQITWANLNAGDNVGSITLSSAVRGSATPIPDSASSTLRAQIETLSTAPPVPLRDQPLSKHERDAIRRETESWESVRARLLSAGADMDPTIVDRAAAHMAADETLVGELRALATDPSTPQTAVVAMYAALGDCGTQPCQNALTRELDRNGTVREQVIAALTRVVEPSVETIDRLLELGDDGHEVTRASIGIVLSRYAERDPADAGARVEQLVGGLDRCSDRLDGWFGLLGNAGLAEAKPALLACLNAQVPAARRALAAGAMRRIPGADVTHALVRLAVDDPSPTVQLACLRALVVRDVGDGDFAPIVAAGIDGWPVPALNQLLDIIENVDASGEVVGSLLEDLSRSGHEEVAARARRSAEGLDP